MLNGFESKKMGNEWVELCGFVNHGDILVYYNNDGKERKATAQYAEWAKHCHGNPPCGTFYRRFRIQLSNGKRVWLNDYI